MDSIMIENIFKKGRFPAMAPVRGLARRFVLALLKKLVIWLVAYLSPVLLIILLFFFVYCILFLIPKYIVEDVLKNGGSQHGRVVAIFNTGERDDWKLGDDRDLYNSYMDLDRKWTGSFIDQEALDNSPVQYHEGNGADGGSTVKQIWGRFYDKDSGIPAERSQVKPHGVSWALLAAVDRVLGDPVITGQPGRKPDPRGHFKRLEPELKWQDFELYYYRSWTEYRGSGENHKPERFTTVYRHNIRLLSEVKSYEAEKITYQWEKKRYYFKDPQSGFVEEAVYPVFVNSHNQGPYFQKLRELLAEEDLVKISNLELILYLAMNYDDEFKYNVGIISGNMAELIIDTENTRRLKTALLGKFQWPAGQYREITSGYGWREHPILGGIRFHKGTDIALPRGAPVFSAWDGEVILADWVTGYGQTVIIDHGKYRTLYAHLMSFSVRPGQEVRQGQEIARADSTGLSDGDHLHFEIRSGAGETEYHDPVLLFGSLPGEEAVTN